MTMTITEIRSKRLSAEIPATLLATRAGINRSRLSCIEHGYLEATEDEMRRLNENLEQLLRAKSMVQRAAADAGWPMAAVSQ